MATHGSEANEVPGYEALPQSPRTKPNKRGNWTKNIDFFLALCGSSIGLENFWRFPYLCYFYGGGAFLIPYFVSIIAAGIPLLILEIGLGQFTGQGPVTAWAMISPLFKGIGCACLVVQALLNTYHVVVMAWGIYYLFYSFRAVLPYSTCDNSWNTPCCVDRSKMATDYDLDIVYDMYDAMNLSSECSNKVLSPTEEFWNRQVLKIHLSEGIDDLGPVNWQLFLCLVFAWVLIYFCVCKGVKTSGKVVYFTVPFPYILLCILFVRAITLPGAKDGIIFYLKPDKLTLHDGKVWLAAAMQIFYSNSLGNGVLVALGSYNKKKHNFVRDTLLYAGIGCVTSFFAGFVVFAALGHMAFVQRVSVHDFASSGLDLGFIAYPAAITQMPLSTLWAVLFFLCLLFLGIDSQFLRVEAFITTVVDLFPTFLLRGRRREVFCFMVCIIYCILALPMVTSGGTYFIQLFDSYSAANFVLLWIAMFESAVIGWVYGGWRFMPDIVDMTGMWFITPYMLVAWMFATPIFAIFMFVLSCKYYLPLTYEGNPWWWDMLGVLMAASSMINIPLWAVYQFAFNSEGSIIQRLGALATSRVPPSVTSTDREGDYVLEIR